MDDSEKELLDILKNFDVKKLFMKETYVEIQSHETFRQAYIREIKGYDKYELFIQNQNGTIDIPVNMLNFYSENDYP